MAFVLPALAAIGGGSTLAGVATAATAVGSIYQGYAASNAMKGQAQQADLNARLTRQQTNATEEAQRRQNALQMGEVRANAVQSGFIADSGSLAALQTKTAAEMELDALTGRYRGELEAIGLQNDARQLRANASTARTSGWLNAAGTVFSSAMRYGGATRIGPPAPIETRIPKPIPGR